MQLLQPEWSQLVAANMLDLLTALSARLGYIRKSLNMKHALDWLPRPNMGESRETAYIWRKTSLETSWSLAVVILLRRLVFEGYIRP